MSLSKTLMCSLWIRGIRDSERRDCSLSGRVWDLVKRLFVIKEGVEQDVDSFFRAKVRPCARQGATGYSME